MPDRPGRRRLRLPFCHHRSVHAGDVLTDGGFQQVWQPSPLFIDLRSPQTGGACAKCDSFEACRGGCVAANFFTGLPLDDPDPECVQRCGEAPLTGERTTPAPSQVHSCGGRSRRLRPRTTRYRTSHRARRRRLDDLAYGTGLCGSVHSAPAAAEPCGRVGSDRYRRPAMRAAGAQYERGAMSSIAATDPTAHASANPTTLGL